MKVYLVNKMVISWWFAYIKVYLVNKMVISWWFAYIKVYLVNNYHDIAILLTRYTFM
jgi:hypothetical protein